MSDLDLRGTQGAVVLPGGTVVQNYAAPEHEEELFTMNQQTPSELSGRMYDHGRELAEIKVRLTAVEVSINQIMLLLQQRPSVAVTINQLIVAIGLALLIVILILGASYAGQ